MRRQTQNFGVRWLDTALDFVAPRLSERPLAFEIESGVKPPHSKIVKLLLMLFLAFPHSASACAVCFGDPSSPWAKALGLGILALLGVVLLVLGGIVAFFVFMAKRARMAQITAQEELQQ